MKSSPLTIKAGLSSVKIYRENRPDGSVYYKLSYHLGGMRHRSSFNDLDEAKNEAAAKAAQLASGDNTTTNTSEAIAGPNRKYSHTTDYYSEFVIINDSVLKPKHAETFYREEAVDGLRTTTVFSPPYKQTVPDPEWRLCHFLLKRMHPMDAKDFLPEGEHPERDSLKKSPSLAPEEADFMKGRTTWTFLHRDAPKASSRRDC